MSKPTNKFSPEVRARAMRTVLVHEGEHASRWAAVASIAGNIGCDLQSFLVCGEIHKALKKARQRVLHRPPISDL